MNSRHFHYLFTFFSPLLPPSFPRSRSRFHFPSSFLRFSDAFLSHCTARCEYRNYRSLFASSSARHGSALRRFNLSGLKMLWCDEEAVGYAIFNNIIYHNSSAQQQSLATAISLRTSKNTEEEKKLYGFRLYFHNRFVAALLRFIIIV